MGACISKKGLDRKNSNFGLYSDLNGPMRIFEALCKEFQLKYSNGVTREAFHELFDFPVRLN